MSTKDLREKEREDMKNFRRMEILDAAKDLILEKGFVNISMAEIAKAAGYSRTTLYRFFSSIQDIGIAILENFLSSMEHPFENEKIITEIESGCKNYYEKLRNAISYNIKYYMKHKKFVIYTSEFDYFFSKETTHDSGTELVKNMKQNPYMVEMYKKGLEEGSVLDKGDADTLVYTINRSLFMYLQEIITREEQLREEARDGESELEILTDIVSGGLKK